MSNNIQNSEFHLRFTAKQLQRAATKTQKEERLAKKKMEQAVEQGQDDIAELRALEAARKRTEYVNLLKLAARVDTVASRVKTAATMGMVTKNMAQVTKAMEIADKNMNPNVISQIMDRFDTQLANVEVSSLQYEDATASLSATTTDSDLAKQLLNDARRKKLGDQLPDTEEDIADKEAEQLEKEIAAKEQQIKEEKLAERLKQLRQPQGAS